MAEDKEKKEVPKKDREAKKQRAYSRYVQDPVFVGLIVLAILLALMTVYFAANGNCPAKPVDDDIDDGDDVIEPPVVGDDGGDGVPAGDKLVIYEFSEFKCPYCAAAAGFNEDLIATFRAQDPTWTPSVPTIKEEYGDQVQVVFKHFIVHDSARKAAEASECARDQGKFWEMHDIMFENMGSLESADLKGYAAEIGLDSTSFDACLDSGEKAEIVEADTAFGRDLGVSGTPTFFIGGAEGYKIVGAQPFSNFEEAIEKALDGEFPEPPPEKGPTIGSFESIVTDDICTEGGKPIVRLFTTTWCPHCRWVGPAFDEFAEEYSGKIVARHWEVDTGDDTLTEAVETTVPDSELAVYEEFNPRGSIPTFVFGCQYYRIGTGYEREDDLEAEKEDFRKVVGELLANGDACTENWICGEWSPCSEQGTQTRTCTDSNSCGTSKAKPPLSQECGNTNPDFDAEWAIFLEFISAVDDRDLDSLYSVTHTDYSECFDSYDEEMCWGMIEGMAGAFSSIKKEDVSEVWKDGKQTILSTKLEQTGSGYGRKQIFFLKDSEGIKLLAMKTLSLSSEDDALDSDKDGRLDADEDCSGNIYDHFPDKCIQTTIGQKDSDSDGLWDGTEVEAETDPNSPSSYP